MVYSFKKSILNNRLHHAYIVEAPFSMNKLAYVKHICKEILCPIKPGIGCNECPTCKKINDENYMDIYLVEATIDKGSKVASVKTKTIENLQEDLQKVPYEGERNIAIIKDADTITPAAFNRLLKTLEEPQPGTVIFLLSENINNLPQTIRSRCVHIRLDDGVTLKSDKGMAEAEELIFLLIDGEYFYKEKNLIEGYAKNKESAYILLDAMESIYSKLALGKMDHYKRFHKDYIFNAVHHIEEARREIQRDFSVKNTLKKMILNIGG